MALIFVESLRFPAVRDQIENDLKNNNFQFDLGKLEQLIKTWKKSDTKDISTLHIDKIKEEYNNFQKNNEPSTSENSGKGKVICKKPKK